MTIGIALLTLLLLTAPAGAASVNSGYVLSNSNFDLDYNLVGDTFSLTCLDIGQCGFVTSPRWFTTLSPPGTFVDLSGNYPIGDANSLILNGTSYRAIGTFNFTAQSVLYTGGASVSTPFSMSAVVDLLHPETLVDLGDFHFTGHGIVTAETTPIGQVGGLGVRYNFLDASNGGGYGTPVIPEPSTVLLVVSGLAGLGVWRYRRDRVEVEADTGTT